MNSRASAGAQVAYSCSNMSSKPRLSPSTRTPSRATSRRDSGSGYFDPGQPERSSADIVVELGHGLPGLALAQGRQAIQAPARAALGVLVDHLVVALDPPEALEALQDGIQGSTLHPAGKHEAVAVLLLGRVLDE